jgi:hypothetical protein
MNRAPQPGRKKSVAPLLDADLVVRRVRVRARDAVFVKGILEASEGLAVLFAEHGGELSLAAPRSREAGLDEIVADLVAELGGVLENDST